PVKRLLSADVHGPWFRGGYASGIPTRARVRSALPSGNRRPELPGTSPTTLPSSGVTDNPRVEARRVRDAGWLASLPLLLNAVSLGANGYIIRRLGPEGYGTLVVAMGLAGATTILSNLGMRALYTKAVAGADDPTTARLLREQLALRRALGAAAGLLAIPAAAVFYPGGQAVMLCTVLQAIVVVLTIGWTVLADVLNARERFAENAIIALKAGLVLTGLATVVAAFGGGPVEVGAA